MLDASPCVKALNSLTSSSALGELHGIAEEIDQHLFQSHLVHNGNARHRRVREQQQLDSLARGGVCDDLTGLLQHPSQVS